MLKVLVDFKIRSKFKYHGHKLKCVTLTERLAIRNSNMNYENLAGHSSKMTDIVKFYFISSKKGHKAIQSCGP